jgi:hypothetical protein
MFPKAAIELILKYLIETAPAPIAEEAAKHLHGSAFHGIRGLDEFEAESNAVKVKVLGS